MSILSMYTAAATFQQVLISAAFCTTLLLLAASNMSNMQAEEGSLSGNESTRIYGELDHVEHHSITYGWRIEEEINLGSSSGGDDQKLELAARLRSAILQQPLNENEVAHRLSSRKLIMGSLSRHHDDDSIISSSRFSSSSSEKAVMIRKSKQLRRQLVEGEALKADQNEAKLAATATEGGAQSLKTDRETHNNAVDDSASFHADYSGPKTHPPRNN